MVGAAAYVSVLTDPKVKNSAPEPGLARTGNEGR